MFQEIKRQADKEWEELWEGGKPLILIGSATCGRSAGSLNTKKSFEDELSGRGIDANIIDVGCMGPCYAEPLVCIIKPDNPGICYRNITPEKAKELVDKYIAIDGEDCDPLAEYALGTTGNGAVEGIPLLEEIPVFKPQERRLFEKLGYIDPMNINHYIAYGGYSGLAIRHEGYNIARWLNTLGVTGVVLKYRTRGGGYGHPAPIQDAQRALQTIRSRAPQLALKPDQIGILGFSAGGHLASSVGTHFQKKYYQLDDPIARISSRPDFMILIYPVITFTDAKAK